MITFSTDNMAIQRFPFPAPTMDYIIKNLQPQHLLKLYQTCKFFYAKYRQNIIRNLIIVDEDAEEEEESFDPTSTAIRVSNPALKQLKDFWITDSVIYRALMNNDFLMPAFSHCTIKKLEACDYLIWEEYKALTKAGTIEDLKVGEIWDKHGDELAPIDDIIALVPNATSIHITACKVTSTTYASLAAMNHKAKITNFVFEDLELFENNNELELLTQYLVKNADFDCHVRIRFQLHPEEDHALVRHYNEMLEWFGRNCVKRIAVAFDVEKKKRALEST